MGMIYVGIIVAICAAEFWIRRRVNKNFSTNEKRGGRQTSDLPA